MPSIPTDEKMIALSKKGGVLHSVLAKSDIVDVTAEMQKDTSDFHNAILAAICKGDWGLSHLPEDRESATLHPLKRRRDVSAPVTQTQENRDKRIDAIAQMQKSVDSTLPDIPLSSIIDHILTFGDMYPKFIAERSRDVTAHEEIIADIGKLRICRAEINEGCISSPHVNDYWGAQGGERRLQNRPPLFNDVLGIFPTPYA